jgi:AAA+ ATPase superfamily predicted ATPase
MNFINRDKELAVLEKDYKRKDSSFTVIYGRRRDTYQGIYLK